MNQLGNRIQHALRAYTPAEIKVVERAFILPPQSQFGTIAVFSTIAREVGRSLIRGILGPLRK